MTGVNGSICKAQSYNTLTYMKSVSDERHPALPAPGDEPKEPPEFWRERGITDSVNDPHALKFATNEDSDCGLIYTVTLVNRSAHTDEYDKPDPNPPPSKEEARFVNSAGNDRGDASDPMPCNKLCKDDPVKPNYRTGIQYGVYDKLLQGNSGQGGGSSLSAGRRRGKRDAWNVLRQLRSVARFPPSHRLTNWLAAYTPAVPTRHSRWRRPVGMSTAQALAGRFAAQAHRTTTNFSTVHYAHFNGIEASPMPLPNLALVK